MVFIRLGLALGTLRLGSQGRWVRLLNRHCPPEVVPLAQEVRLGVKAEASFPQDHARVVLLGAGVEAKLQ